MEREAAPAIRTKAEHRAVSPVLLSALALSMALHVLVLATGFIDPAPPPSPSTSRIDVTLVNARSAPPEQAELLAQTDLDAGGTEQDIADTPPTTPAPPAEDTPGEALADAQAAPPAAEAEEQPELLTSPATPEPAAATVQERESRPERTEPQQRGAPRGQDLMNAIADVARLETRIDRSLQAYSERPRKRFIGARAREHRFAQYVENWRRKVERVGNLNYPAGLYGSLLLSVVIRADGSVETVEVRRSSGKPELDQAAVRIVEQAAPFAAFPPNIRDDTDVIEITRTWTFTNSERFHTH